MKIIPFYALFFTLLLFSCQSLLKVDKWNEEDPIKEAITTLVCQEAERRKLEIVACGMPENQADHRFAIHYYSCKKLKIDETRKLFVDLVETFLNQINRDEKIISSLEMGTITIAHLNFTITFADVEGQFREPPFLAYAFLKNDRICYCYYDNLFGKFTEYKDIEEDYQEAKLKIRKMESTDDPL
jgi:hypothetical protein